MWEEVIEGNDKRKRWHCRAIGEEGKVVRMKDQVCNIWDKAVTVLQSSMYKSMPRVFEMYFRISTPHNINIISIMYNEKSFVWDCENGYMFLLLEEKHSLCI